MCKGLTGAGAGLVDAYVVAMRKKGCRKRNQIADIFIGGVNMPEIRYCRECRRIFHYVTGPVLCDSCRKIEEEEFDKVRNFP